MLELLGLIAKLLGLIARVLFFFCKGSLEFDLQKLIGKDWQKQEQNA